MDWIWLLKIWTLALTALTHVHVCAHTRTHPACSLGKLSLLGLNCSVNSLCLPASLTPNSSCSDKILYSHQSPDCSSCAGLGSCACSVGVKWKNLGFRGRFGLKSSFHPPKCMALSEVFSHLFVRRVENMVMIMSAYQGSVEGWKLEHTRKCPPTYNLKI